MQSGPHRDISGLEAHEGPVSPGRSGRHWLREIFWRVEVRRLCHFLFQLGTFLFCFTPFVWKFLDMERCGVCVLQSCVPNEQAVPLLSLLWTVHLSTGHDRRGCEGHPSVSFPKYKFYFSFLMSSSFPSVCVVM